MINAATWNASPEVQSGANPWGPIPEAKEFQHPSSMGYQAPVSVRGWGWSTTFNRWGAYVTFADTGAVFTWPKRIG